MWMSSWVAYDDGRSIGSVGAEGGVILRDEVYASRVRVTLKRGEKHISVSCNIYGWMDHARFYNSISEALREYKLMKPLLANMVENILPKGEGGLKMWEAIAEFVRRFP
jgi:hypothetical protein